MSLESELDIRWPIGLLFLVLGVLIAIYGAAAPQITTTAGHSINLNLVWGVVMILFGAFMIWGARRAGKRKPEAEPTERSESAHHRA